MKHKKAAQLQRLFALFKSKLCFCGRQLLGIGNSASGPFWLTEKSLEARTRTHSGLALWSQSYFHTH